MRWQVLFDVGGDDVAQRRAWLRGLELGIEGGQDQGYPGLAVDQGVPQLGLGKEETDGHDDGSRLPGAQLAYHPLRAIGQDQRHPIAFLDAQGHQGRGQGVAELFHLPAGKARALEEQRGVIRPLLSRIAYHVDQCSFRVRLQGVRHSAVILQEPLFFHLTPPRCSGCPSA